MGGSSKPTAKQLARIDELNNKKRTEKQDIELSELIAKRDAKPQLLQGAKTYCEQWLKEQLYGKVVSFSNKYTEKGIECEDDGIEMVARMQGYGMIKKNEQFYQDDYSTGTPDLVLGDTVEDVKCPWLFSTFPLFEDELPNKDYWWQIQRYMHLTGKRKGTINYTLVNAPEHLIEREARNQAYKAGLDEVPIELYDEVYAKMTYNDTPDNLRFKRYEFEYDEAANLMVDEQVKLCRVYIDELMNKLK